MSSPPPLRSLPECRSETSPRASLSNTAGEVASEGGNDVSFCSRSFMLGVCNCEAMLTGGDKGWRRGGVSP